MSRLIQVETPFSFVRGYSLPSVLIVTFFFFVLDSSSLLPFRSVDFDGRYFVSVHCKKTHTEEKNYQLLP